MKISKHAKSLAVAAIALAFVCVAFAFTTKANAATIEGMTVTYNPETDSIDLEYTDTSMDKAKVAVYVLRDGTTGMAGTEKAKYTTAVSGSSVSIALNDSKKGLKVAQNKDLYVFISVSGAAIKDQKANFKIAKNEVKVKSVAVNYGKAYDGNDDAVLTVKLAEGTTTLDKVIVTDIYTGSDKKKTTGDSFTGAEFQGGVLYSLINETYYDSKKKKDVAIKHTISVAVDGGTVSGFDAQRVSKSKTVALKAPANGKAVKVDYLKGTIALKSGFDFVVVSTGGAISADYWYTILPADSTNGTYTTNVYKQTVNYSYVKKLGDTATAADKANFYKGSKIKSLGLEEICETAWGTEYEGASPTAIIYVRKTATDKAPASKSSEALRVAKPLEAPTFTVTTGSISAYNSTKKTFGALGSGISGKNANAKAGSEYEYLVVSKAKYDAELVDYSNSKWTKLNPTKEVKINLKSSGVVYFKTAAKTETEKVTVQTWDKDNSKLVDDIYILIRGAGVKEVVQKKVVKTAGALPTGIVATKFVKVGESFEWQEVK